MLTDGLTAVIALLNDILKVGKCISASLRNSVIEGLPWICPIKRIFFAYKTRSLRQWVH
jgi:hypothetical protein